MKHILNVEDETILMQFLVQVLLGETPHHVMAAYGGAEALNMVQHTTLHLLILDYILPYTTIVER